jgi:hypothetical protein
MLTTPNTPVLSAHQEKNTTVTGSPSETASSTHSGGTQKEFSAIAIVKIPLQFSEEKVKILIGSMEAQFEGTGHKVIFVPEEVDISVVGCPPLPINNKKNLRQR